MVPYEIAKGLKHCDRQVLHIALEMTLEHAKRHVAEHGHHRKANIIDV